jgi:23S rRNA (adenine-N6)-dimethyltransferase
VSAGRPTRWGWHELSDGWARRLVAGARVAPGDLVLDIGAGTGAITAQLVAVGARVVAVELHPRRASLLRDRFAGDPVKVVQADACDLRLPRRPFLVVANPPFAAVAAIMKRLLRSQLVRAELVLPSYAAPRWANDRRARGFVVASRAHVPRSAFRPAAPSDAALVMVARRF